MSSKHPITSQMIAQSSPRNTALRANSESDSSKKQTGPPLAQPSEESRTQSDITASSVSTASACVPTSVRPEDIVCGRGLHIMNRHGNLNLHLLVNKYRETYNSSTRRDKAAIARNIVQEIKSTGARFLRRLDENKKDGRWVEVDDNTAYKKVSHALRLRKGDHGRKFLKSIEILQESNDHMASASRAQAFAPIGGTVGPAVLPDGIGNSLGLSSLVPPNLAGWYSGSQPHTFHLQPHVGQHSAPPPPLPYAPSQPQGQPLYPFAYGHVNGYGNVTIPDPHLFARVFSSTLAIMSRTAHQQHNIRSSLDGIPESLHESSPRRYGGEEGQEHR